MYCLLLLSLILLWNSSLSQSAAEVAYTDLVDLDAVCPNLDTCSAKRELDSLDKYTCHCGNYCSRLGTCCIDSKYTKRKRTTSRIKPTCKAINGENYFPYYFIDYCPPKSNDNVYNQMCKQEWTEGNDLMPIVPVTSLFSNQTYKNFYCLRCHESTEDYVYWEIKVTSNELSNIDLKNGVKLMYDKPEKTWEASVGEYVAKLFFKIPEDFMTVPKVCVTDAISSCSPQWKVRVTSRKCAAYTSFVYIVKDEKKVLYRNPHCAVCNFESLDTMGCFVQSERRTTVISERRPFSFTYLLDINRKDGDKVGKIQRCDDDSTWDPFFEKCRLLTCALPQYKVKDGKCVPP